MVASVDSSAAGLLSRLMPVDRRCMMRRAPAAAAADDGGRSSGCCDTVLQTENAECSFRSTNHKQSHSTAFNCRILYGLYLPTVILTIIWYSITHSLFYPRLKTSLLCKSFPPQPFLFLLQDSLHGFPRLFTVTSAHIRLYFFYFFLFYTFQLSVPCCGLS